MNTFLQSDWIEICELFALTGVFLGGVALRSRLKSLTSRISALEEKIKISVDAEVKRAKFYEDITSPEKIIKDMEVSASADEMRRAKRLTAPRPDAGPSAIIHKPKGVRASGGFEGNRPHTNDPQNSL